MAEGMDVSVFGIPYLKSRAFSAALRATADMVDKGKGPEQIMNALLAPVNDELNLEFAERFQKYCMGPLDSYNYELTIDLLAVILGWPKPSAPIPGGIIEIPREATA